MNNWKRHLWIVIVAVVLALIPVGMQNDKDDATTTQEVAIVEEADEATVEEPDEAVTEDAVVEADETVTEADEAVADVAYDAADEDVAVEETATESSDEQVIVYTFRNDDLLDQHYEKHGIEMGFTSSEEYEEAASAVINNPDSLHKTEKEDGDDVYYLEDTNEFVILSTDGFIRTYFNPNAGKAYYDRQ